MTFHPVQCLGQPLPQFLAELARIDPHALERAEQVELFSPLAADEAVSLRPTTLMQSTILSANLPADHPDVDLPGVTLESFLGGGGQGWVYLARVHATNHVVAVKVLRSDTGSGAAATAAREATLCARVRHRNVLRIFRTEEAGAFAVVIMELVQGAELHRAALAGGQLKRCLGQLADALAELGRNQIVHCDVKPPNVLLREHDGSPVLVDFGVAQDLADPVAHRGISGTPYFMAPEVFRDNLPHFAWDAYALGVSAAVLAAGRTNLYHTFHEIHDAKVSGAFDRALREHIAPLADHELRDVITGLIDATNERRLAALESARAWQQLPEPSVN